MALRKQVIHFQNEPVEIVYTDKTGHDGVRYYFFEITPIARLMNIEHPLSKINSQHVIEEVSVAADKWSKTVRITLVSEAGLYQLIFSGKPATVRQSMVRNWLFEVVLPSIKIHTDNNPQDHNNYSQQFEQLNLNGATVPSCQPSCISSDVLNSFKHIIEMLENQIKQNNSQIERVLRTTDEQLARREREIEIKNEQLLSKEKQLKNALSLVDLKEQQLTEIISLMQKKDRQLEHQFNMLGSLIGQQIKVNIEDEDDEHLPQNHDTVLMIVRENPTTFKGITAKRRYVDQQKQKLRYHESMIVVHSKRPDPKRDWNAAMDMINELGVKDRCQIYPNLKRVRFEIVKDADAFEKGLKKMFNVTDAC